jgi:methyltransferase (TIGR00027 family)
MDPALAASCMDRAAVLHHALRASPAVGPLVRARYVEEALFAALADQVRQYVIIGAGLDTFAFRRPDLKARLRVIEIDHPASQASKRERLAKAGLIPPANLYFAAADLERESVPDALGRTPYERTVRTFFAWPGVTAYLTQNAIFETLKSIASVGAPGSRLVFDYIEPAALGADAPPRHRLLAQLAQQAGEPLLSGLNPTTLKSDLAGLGFQLVEDLGRTEIQARFLARARGFQAMEYLHMAQAVIGPTGPA